MLWSNYFPVARTLSQIPGATMLQPPRYWSSSEYGSNNAWTFEFGIGYADRVSKSGTYYVRAVRAF
jgi:hypothetical protein